VEGLTAGEGHKAAKKRVKDEQIARVAKVIGISKLRTKYEAHEAKRQLCSQYDLFLADARIIPSLPKLLGARLPTRAQLTVQTPPSCQT
jgi:ribosome biogenesis protein UTP30